MIQKKSLSKNNTRESILTYGLFVMNTIVLLFVSHYATAYINPVIETVTYRCAEDKSITVVYKKYSADFDMNTHGLVHARQIIRGIKYISGSITLWHSGEDMMIENKDSVPYYSCSLNGPPPDDLQTQPK